MSLRSLATKSGLSAGFLSQLENNRTNASVASLRKIAAALGVTLALLLDGKSSHTTGVLRARDRPTFPMEGGEKFVLSLPPLRNLEVYAGVFEPGVTTGDEPYAHGNSQEMFVVVRGSVTLQLGDEFFDLERWDSIEYLSSVPHGVANNTDFTAEVMWISSPPDASDEVVAHGTSAAVESTRQTPA